MRMAKNTDSLNCSLAMDQSIDILNVSNAPSIINGSLGKMSAEVVVTQSVSCSSVIGSRDIERQVNGSLTIECNRSKKNVGQKKCKYIAYREQAE